MWDTIMKYLGKLGGKTSLELFTILGFIVAMYELTDILSQQIVYYAVLFLLIIAISIGVVKAYFKLYNWARLENAKGKYEAKQAEQGNFKTSPDIQEDTFTSTLTSIGKTLGQKGLDAIQEKIEAKEEEAIENGNSKEAEVYRTWYELLEEDVKDLKEEKEE